MCWWFTHTCLSSPVNRKYWSNLRLDRLGERPSLHLGLEPHVVDLESETVSVHDELIWAELWGLSLSDWLTDCGLAASRLSTTLTSPHLTRLQSRDRPGLWHNLQSNVVITTSIIATASHHLRYQIKWPSSADKVGSFCFSKIKREREREREILYQAQSLVNRRYRAI